MQQFKLTQNSVGTSQIMPTVLAVIISKLRVLTSASKTAFDYRDTHFNQKQICPVSDVLNNDFQCRNSSIYLLTGKASSFKLSVERTQTV